MSGQVRDSESIKQLEFIGKIIDHSNKWGETIHDLRTRVGDAHNRIDLLEMTFTEQKKLTEENKVALGRVERRLEKAEEQREKFNNYMGEEVRELKTTVVKLSENDDSRHAELVDHISTLAKHVDNLAEITSKNTDYISEAEAKEREEAYAKQKVEEALAPEKKVKNQIIMTTVGVITVFILGVLGKLGLMAINLDKLVDDAKKTEVVSKNR